MEQRERIRTIIRTMYDFQDMRIRMANRLKKKRDGSDQINADDIDIEVSKIPSMVDAWKDAQEIEKNLSKSLESELKGIPIYEDFLKNVKGCGVKMSAVIIAEYDIHKATTVSKLWQFTGLNSGMVKGNKTSGSKKDGTFKIIKTDEMVKGDKRTAGFMSPYNGWLRTKICGVLADSFIKSKSSYREYYDDMKQRLKNSENIIQGKDKKWCETTKGHRHRAAIRHMMKMFLKDLYVEWRTAEGLPVRPPYAEEYLGKKHA